MFESATAHVRFAGTTALPLEASFDGGRLTSDGGLPWLEEADGGLGLCGAFAAVVPEWRHRARSVRHSLATLVRQRVFQIACGYEDQNDANTLRADPLLKVVCGRHDGPRVTILGGIHGDEYEGITGASLAWRDLDAEALRGTVMVVPTANPLACAAGSRTTPADARNLARSFPGRPDGTVTERIAHTLDEQVIAGTDVLVDLHSAGQHYAMPLLVGSYTGPDALGRRCQETALAFGAPIYWAHPAVAPGRSLSSALDRGVPCIYAECGGGGRIRSADLDAYRAGVRRALAHLGALPGEHQTAISPPLRLRGSGDTDAALTAAQSGLLIERARLLERVDAGAPLADLITDRGAPVDTILAPRPGIVIMARRTARVRAGDATHLLTDVD